VTALIVSNNQAGEASSWPKVEVVEKGVASYSGATAPIH